MSPGYRRKAVRTARALRYYCAPVGSARGDDYATFEQLLAKGDGSAGMVPMPSGFPADPMPDLWRPDAAT